MLVQTKSKAPPLFALIDCNNFYVSCERAFNPKLTKKPVVILSNNDGCIISRSNEAKLLGFKMGEPYFKALPLIKRHGVAVFSSNYSLYADMSMRVMSIIAKFSPEIEIYSIDEAFIDIRGVAHVEQYAQEIRQNIYKATGIPVSIGVASTKTLAKLANNLAKKSGGVFVLNEEMKQSIFSKLELGEIWGIGKKWANLLQSKGIFTIEALVDKDDAWIKQNMNIAVIKTVYELRGVTCIRLEEIAQAPKSITVSRAFGTVITNFEELSQAVITFVTRAAEKLRIAKKLVKHLSVSIQTNRFSKQGEYYSNSINIDLMEATDYTTELIEAVVAKLKIIYKSGQQYKKAGIIMTGLCDSTDKQMNLFGKRRDPAQKALMQSLDKINEKYGRSTIFYAGSGIKKPWLAKNDMISQSFTTNWKKLLVVS